MGGSLHVFVSGFLEPQEEINSEEGQGKIRGGGGGPREEARRGGKGEKGREESGCLKFKIIYSLPCRLETCGALQQKVL